jgi:hypothetical protein
MVTQGVALDTIAPLGGSMVSQATPWGTGRRRWPQGSFSATCCPIS